MAQTRPKSAVKSKTRAPAAKAAKKLPAKKAAAKKSAAKKTVTKPIRPAIDTVEKKSKKQKVVRDSFTMPKAEYDHIARLKLQCVNAGMAVKKSELLRAGLLALALLTPPELVRVLSSLDTVKTGRPLSNSANDPEKINKKRKKTKKK